MIWYIPHFIYSRPVNKAFNLPHYVISYMHHTGKKEILELKVNVSDPLDHLGKGWQLEFKRGIYSFSMVIDSFEAWLFRFFFFFNFLVEFNL